jgi:energy-coupling factor transporter ATP-binding protein EcfA2
MATVRTRTYFNNKFITGYRPTQTDYQDLFLTIPMKKEVADRAKVYTGSSSLETEVGLVVLATNTQAKTNATQLTDRSVVLQPHQNNTCVSASDIINSNLATFEGIIVDVTADATTTRNNFVIRFSTLFKSFLGTTFNDIAARLLPAQDTHASKYLKTNGTTASWEKVDLTTSDSVSGVLPIGSGGTGQTTITNAINALLPSQISNSGKVLGTDGTNISWVTSTGLPVGGSTDQVLKKVNGTDYNVAYSNSVLPEASTPNLKIKVIQIGAWNMDSVSTKSVTHGLADVLKIRDISAMILDDAGTSIRKLDGNFDGVNFNGGIDDISALSIVLQRFTTGIFDDPEYDDAVINRGYLTITYEE